MPAATRAEALVGIPEVKDGALASYDIYEGPAVKARIEQLPHFPPLGAADMLYIRKRYVPVVGAPKIYGYYHFIRAVDVSSVAAVSAYIVDVVRNTGLDQASWSPGWELASTTFGGFEIASVTFIAYNCMSKADVFVHVDLPGSTTARATDHTGHDIPVDDLFWQELFVSSFIRHLASHGEQPLYPCLRVLSYSPRAEAAFLDAAAACVHRWHLSGTDGMKEKTDSASKSRVAKIIRDYFLDTSRYDAAVAFFSRASLLDADPTLVLYAAAGARLKGNLDAAARLVDELLTMKPESDLAWLERARVFRAQGKIEEALEAAKTASGYADDEADVWILLADLYVDARQYAKAFEALNSADMPPPSLDPYLRKLVPNRKNLTNPVEGNSGGADAVLVLAKKLREEKNKTNDKTDDTLLDLPARMLTDAEPEHDCYVVLVKILKDLTWDDMLAVRGDCFVMEADVLDGRLEASDEDTDEHEEDGGVEEAQGEEKSDDDEIEPNGANVSEHQESNKVEIQETSGDTKIDLEDTEDHSDGVIPNGADDESIGYFKKRALEKIGKQVCKPWLDYLVLNMYNDLKAMAQWNAEEQQHATSAALAATAIARRSQSENSATNPDFGDVEAPEPDQPIQRTVREIIKTTRRPATDWLRRGELAMRLGKLEEAKTAFGVCTKLSDKEKTVALTALLHLMALAADGGDTKTTLRCADAVWTHMDALTDRRQSSDPSPAVPQVRKTIFKLISKKGLRSIREVVYQVELDRKRIESLLLDSVALGVEGFSR